MAENTDIENKTAASPVKKKGMSFALSAIIVGIGLIITKGSGLIRDVIVSLRFSQGIYRDAYTLAFNIPDLFYNLLVGGAIYSTIAPYMSAQLAVGREEEGIKTVSKFITVVCIVMVICCTIGTVFSEPLYVIYGLFNDVKNPDTIPLAAQASKLLFPQIFFIMLAALCNGILIAYRKFTITSFAPVFYNILVIAAIFICGGNSLNRLMMTTGGILAASVFYFLFQYTLGFKQMKKFRLNFHLADREFLKLFVRAIPILISASVIQLSGDYEAKRFQKASTLISHSMKSALFMTIPSAIFMAVLNVDVVKAVYQWHSNYTDRHAQTAAIFLLGFCSSIITATVVHVFNQAFYAIGQTKLPLIAGVIGLIINPVACHFMVVTGVGPLSLSLAYSFTNICQMIILAITYCRRKELAPYGIVRFLIKATVCVVVMALVVFVLDRFLPAQGGKITQLLIISIKGAVAVVVYFGMAVLLRMQEATEWINKFKSKVFKKTAAKKA